MDRLQIIGAPQSSYVRVAWMSAEEKGADYELVPAPPHSPDVLAIHPMGKIPVMRHGAFALCESKAIATYIDRAFSGPRLIPEDAAAAARVEQWVSLTTCCVQPAFAPYVGGYFFSSRPDGAPDRNRIDAAAPGVERALEILARGVAATGHLVGEAFTLADIAALSHLHYPAALPESSGMIAARPALAAYIERHAGRSSVRATVPPPLPTDDAEERPAPRKAAAAS